MTNIRSFVEKMTALQADMQEAIEQLEDVLKTRADYLRRWDRYKESQRVADQVRRRMKGLVLDTMAPFVVRPARIWVVVGPSGVPREVEVVGESTALANLGHVIQPDLEGFKNRGRTVIEGERFLQIVGWLKKEVLDGSSLFSIHLSEENA